MSVRREFLWGAAKGVVGTALAGYLIPGAASGSPESKPPTGITRTKLLEVLKRSGKPAEVVVNPAVYRLGAGRFILNTLRIRENPDHPSADRLLLNMISYASQGLASAPAPLPHDFEKRLKKWGFE